VTRRDVSGPYGVVHVRSCTGGTNAEGSRPVWILLHQSPLSSRRFLPLLPVLGRWADVYAPDTPGYGDSDPTPPTWSVEECAASLWSAVDAVTDGPVHLMGRATGSVLAVAMAAARLDSIQHLVLHGLPVYTDQERQDRLADFAPPYVLSSDGSHLDCIWRRITGEYPWAGPKLVTSMVADYLAAGPDFATAYRAMWRYPLADGLAQVRRAELPVTLLTGGRDRIAFMAERARRVLPDAAEYVMPQATDFVAEQDPEGFADVLRQVPGGVARQGVPAPGTDH